MKRTTTNFMEEIKAAVSGEWFKSKPKRKQRPTAEKVCMEELYKEDQDEVYHRKKPQTKTD